MQIFLHMSEKCSTFVAAKSIKASCVFAKKNHHSNIYNGYMGRTQPHLKRNRKMTRQEKQALGFLLAAPIVLGAALLGAGSTKKTRRASSVGKSAFKPYSNNTSSFSSYGVDVDFDGKEIIMTVKDNLTGRIIYDESIINKIKRSPEYKRAVAQVMEDKKQEVDRINQSFVEVCQLTPKITPIDKLEKELDKLCPQEYTPVIYKVAKPSLEEARRDIIEEAKSSFGEEKPDAEIVKKILENEADSKYPSFRFISKLIYVSKNSEKRLQEEQDAWQKRLEAFIKLKVDEQLDKLYNDRVSKWEEDKRIHDEKEQEIVKKMNAFYQEEFEKKQDLLIKRLDGDENYVNTQIDAVLSEIDLPHEFSFEYVYDQEKCLLCLNVDLPEIEDIPNQKAVYLSSGKVSVKAKTQSELRHDYAKTVCGLAFYLAGKMYEISPNIDLLRIAGYTQRTNKRTDIVEDQYIYVVLFEREPFMALNFKTISPIAAMQQFSHTMNISASGEMKAIDVNNAGLTTQKDVNC